MKIRTRLFLQGALLPAAAMAGLVLGGGLLFRRALLASVDESLETQAALETVSMFDAYPSPHLHLARSALIDSVAAYAASRAIYDGDGRRIVSELDRVPLPEEAPLPEEMGRSHLSTLDLDGLPVRELRVGFHSPDGLPHTLVLRESLVRIEKTLGTYHRVLGLAGALVTLGFVLLHARASRWWSNRIYNLLRHLRRLERGELSSRPKADLHQDEIGELAVALARASEQLEKSQRARERLVADAAHELRTPLAAMRAEIDVTLRRPREPETLRESLETVRVEIDRLSAMSDQLLDLARLAHAQLEMQTLDLVRLARERVDAHRSLAADAGVELSLEGPSRLEARVDASSVGRAIDNLLANAVEHAPRGTRVTVRVDGSAGKWRVEVSDLGRGIPEADRDAVFEPFRRVDARTPGTGLGLAIVADILGRHGGRAYVAEAERGTRAVLEAPSEPGLPAPS